MASGGDATSGVTAAVVGFMVTTSGAVIVFSVRGRPTREVHTRAAAGWSAVVIGGLVPTIVFTGWLPSRRPRSRSDLEVETVLGRVGIGLATAVVLIALMSFLASPKRGGGFLQRYLARQWRHGTCKSCGMARFRAEAVCSYCGIEQTAPSQAPRADET